MNVCDKCYLRDRYGKCHWKKGDYYKIQISSIMDKYEEALAKARAGKSLDERIRKEITDYLSRRADVTRFIEETKDCERWIAYLERQKENPKSADSIPADCTSDVKCEDRWHKVGDSLPNNGRLVLAKDCLGNTLLARYDCEGNWEVSVYDDADYYCRNTITKWCEIPLEKQKLAEWSGEDEEIMWEEECERGEEARREAY